MLSVGFTTRSTWKTNGVPALQHCAKSVKAADEVGLSPAQVKTAIRVPRVPKEDFERKVESADPPTTALLLTTMPALTFHPRDDPGGIGW
jgi:hypothetical protein